MTELRIGVHANDRSLAALRRCGILEELLAERGARAVWVEYDDSRRTIDLLAAGDLHVAGTGVAPPLRALSEGVAVAYVAVSGPQPVAGAVVVRPGSVVGELGDLRGRRVALARGSGPTLLLAAVLDRAGAAYRDLDVELLPAPLARRALLDGHVDAWLDHEPPAQRERALRELPGGRAAVADRTVWFARRDVAAEHPDLVETLVVTLRRPPCAAQPVTRAVVAEQQQVADLLAGQGVLQLPVNVGAAVAPVFERV